LPNRSNFLSCHVTTIKYKHLGFLYRTRIRPGHQRSVIVPGYIQGLEGHVSYPDTSRVSKAMYRTRIHPGSRRPCIVPDTSRVSKAMYRTGYIRTGYIQGLGGQLSYPDTSRVSEASYRTRIHPGSRRPYLESKTNTFNLSIFIME